MNTPPHLLTDAQLALSCLDLTELSDTCTPADVQALCEKAQGHVPGQSMAVDAVAAVCVWPRFAAQARTALPAHIAVAAVVNFPSGHEPLADVLAQIRTVREAGAQEVDCVLPWPALVAGDARACADFLREVRAASHGLVLKLILETGALPDAATVRHASDLGLAAGVDFLKTSTGKISHGASLPAAREMLQAIQQDPRRDVLGFKPSGGLRSMSDVQPYLQLVRDTVGADMLVPSRFRIGASGLWNHIVGVLGAENTEPDAPTTY